jgi:hypothetical protein
MSLSVQLRDEVVGQEWHGHAALLQCSLELSGEESATWQERAPDAAVDFVNTDAPGWDLAEALHRGADLEGAAYSA